MSQTGEAARLRRTAGELGLELSSGQEAQLMGYLALLQRWNHTYNLTSIRDPEQMLIQHLYDCLAIVNPLRRELPSSDARLLDVGSGGGLPGVVVAILQPGWAVDCVDTVGKKAAFVRQVAGELQLPRLTAIHSRVEALTSTVYDLIASRAFSSLEAFTRLTISLMKPQAKWLAMKGRTPTDEIAALSNAVKVFHVEQLVVPQLNAERCLVWMQRRTPS